MLLSKDSGDEIGDPLRDRRAAGVMTKSALVGGSYGRVDTGELADLARLWPWHRGPLGGITALALGQRRVHEDLVERQPLVGVDISVPCARSAANGLISETIATAPESANSRGDFGRPRRDILPSVVVR